MSIRKFSVIPCLVGLGVALLLFLLLPAEKLPVRLIGLFAGEPVKRIDVVGGTLLQLDVRSGEPRIVQDVAANLRLRLDRMGIEADTVVEGSTIYLAVMRTEPSEAQWLIRRLEGTGVLEFKMVDHDSTFMNAVVRAVDRDDRARDAGIVADVESWVHMDSMDRFNDAYLAAPSRHDLALYLAGLDPEPDRELAIEELADGRARSYYLLRRAELDTSHVVDAAVIFNPTTNRAEVLVTFDEEGAELFGALTSAHVGHKVAIVVNGRITSAPVIQAAIHGGRTTITMGGSDRSEIQRECEDLAGALRAGPLPAPIDHTATAANPIRVSAASLLLARLTLALFVGLLLFGATLAVQRVVAPAQPIAEARALGGAVSSTTRPWLRLLVTIAAPVLVIYSGRLLLPGINGVELQNLLVDSHDPRGAGAVLSVFALGLSPILSAFILVEIVALAVPGWRPHRETSRGRIRLVTASVALAALLALFQGFMVAIWAESIGRGGGGVVAGEIVADPGFGFRAITALSLTAGTLCLIFLAWLVSRFGLGNGFSILLATALVAETISLMRHLREFSPVPIEALALIGGAAVVVLATVWVLRVRVGGRRVPTSGLVPVGWGSSVVQLITSLALFGVLVPEGWLAILTPTSFASFAVFAGTVIVGSALLSFLFSRERPLSAPNLVTTGYLLALAGIYYLLLRYTPMVYFDIITLTVGTAVLMDIYDEWLARTRHTDLVHVYDEHKVQRIDGVIRVLHDAGVPAHARAAGHRALLHFFGPFVPVSIFVPRDRVDDAVRVLAKVATPSSP